MCKTSLPLLFLLFSASVVSAQGNQWTWMAGDNTVNGSGIYGAKGVPAASNKPGGRAFAVSWADPSNNLWMFGGVAFVGASNGYTNDLWKYMPSTGLWTWVSGDNVTHFADQSAVYGSKGVAAPGNKPGAKLSAVSWTDANGNLWLFGGQISSPVSYNMNDLWKYTPSTDLWTWMSGDSARDQPGIYGTKGIAAPGNKPGARQDGVTWTDGAGNLWLYGGQGFAANNAFGLLNDLWRYSISNGQWTWMAGENFPNQSVIYGTRGIAAAANTPGARLSMAGWKDTAGNLWLFGEYGYYAPGAIGLMNDLWKYTPSTGQWTWIGGDNIPGQPGMYGTKGLAAPGNKPGIRYQSYNWTDVTGKFWLFGGGSTPSSNAGMKNDLWQYDPLTNLWTWISGDSIPNQLNVYGTKGISSPNNKPGGRWWGVTWTDTSGNLWLHGGHGYAASGASYLNDLWRFTVPASAPPVAAPDAIPFTITGNPVQDNLMLSIQHPAAQKLVFQISDLNGHVLISEERLTGQGSTRLTIPVSRLSKGSYMIRVQTGNSSSTQTFIKQ